ncbi:MAG: SDR family oxidoreductase [Acidobacteria bacterium]|nr:SDR family oxidoreductase [Acidobacteriota bacterium]MBI3281368.1 SDR family oxidoreductase [Acidobacteriota bacterium]
MERLKNKVALITGAAGGIGAEMARLFAAEGAAVIIADIAAQGGEVARAILEEGGRAHFVETDVADAAAVDRVFTEAERLFGGLDVLVNNAISSEPDTTVCDLEEAVWDRTIDVCLKGPFLCTRRAIPLMRVRGGGSIVTLSSVNALFGVGETAYTAAKGGLISMMRLVAAEYGEWKIRSNIICPGTIATRNCMEYWSRFPAGYARLLEMYPLRRIGEPHEVAHYALFLASDESAFVTGAVAVIDGGLLAGRRFEVE